MRGSNLLLAALMALGLATALAQPHASDLKTSPKAITVDGRHLTLAAYLWRDFMPLSPPDGKPLLASITLKTRSGEPLPEGVDIDDVWVVLGEMIWSPTIDELRAREENSPTLEIVLRNGPKWEPGSVVDVVVQVVDAQGQPYRLMAPQQTIQRTD